MIRLFMVLLLLCLLFLSCSFSWDDPTDDPISVFDYFWNEMNMNYAGFIVKDIDWDQIRNVYRPLIISDPTHNNLENVLKEIVDLLNDDHIKILTSSKKIYPDPYETFMDYDVIVNHINSIYYGSNYFYGYLDNLAYLNIMTFSSNADDFATEADSWAKELKSVFRKMESCDGLILYLMYGKTVGVRVQIFWK